MVPLMTMVTVVPVVCRSHALLPTSCLILAAAVCVAADTLLLQLQQASSVRLSNAQECFIAVFLALDRRNPDSFFQPFYSELCAVCAGASSRSGRAGAARCLVVAGLAAFTRPMPSSPPPLPQALSSRSA